MSLTILPEGPQKMGPITVRSAEIIGLFSDLRLDDQVTEAESPSLLVGPYKNLTLYLSVESTGTPTTIQVLVRYRNRLDGQWYTHNQDPFTSLIYAAPIASPGLHECFTGPIAGREFSIKVISTGTNASDTFKVSAAVEFFA